MNRIESFAQALLEDPGVWYSDDEDALWSAYSPDMDIYPLQEIQTVVRRVFRYVSLEDLLGMGKDIPAERMHHPIYSWTMDIERELRPGVDYRAFTLPCVWVEGGSGRDCAVYTGMGPLRWYDLPDQGLLFHYIRGMWSDPRYVMRWGNKRSGSTARCLFPFTDLWEYRV